MIATICLDLYTALKRQASRLAMTSREIYAHLLNRPRKQWPDDAPMQHLTESTHHACRVIYFRQHRSVPSEAPKHLTL